MLKFGVYEPLNRYLARWVPRGGAAELVANYVTAAVAFLATTLVIVPGELIKTRLRQGIALWAISLELEEQGLAPLS